MNWQTISIRLLISIVMSGIIGYEREYHSRPAGVRTHMMVCIGATIIAMIQEQVSLDAINFAIENPEISSVVRYDKTRIIAQVVSGVGFLGAGTIMVQKRSVYGLTTAATIWAVAALGIAIGLGYYDIDMIQEQVSLDAINFAIENPEISSVVRYDKTRIIAQVVSGVGFLGAGTIMVQKRSVYGLTTAATIWAVAALGIAIGLGYYD